MAVRLETGSVKVSVRALTSTVRPFGATSALVLALGALLVCRLVSATPGIRLALAAAAIVWLPGYIALSLCRPFPKANLFERMALAFALGVGLLCLESLPAYAFRLRLSLVLGMHLALALVFSFVIARRARLDRVPGGRTIRASSELWAGLGLLVPYAALGGAWALHRGPLGGGDTWFHLADLSSLIRGARVDPGCSWFLGVGADPRYPWPGFHFVGAAVALLAGEHAVQLWTHLPFAYPLIGLCSFAMLARRVFGSEPVMWAAVLVAWFALPISLAGLDSSVKYPYPMALFSLGIQPVYLALLASYLQNRNRSVLLPLAICAYAGGSLHAMGILVTAMLLPVIGLLMLLAPVRKRARVGLVWATAVTVAALTPRILIQAANYASDGDTGIAASTVAVGHGLRAVSPDALANPWMVTALALSLFVAPFAAKRPGLLVLVAVAFLAPVYAANPVFATYLAPRTTAYLLRRLYSWPRVYLFGPLLLAAIPVSLATIWSQGRARLGSARLHTDSETTAVRARRDPAPDPSRPSVPGMSQAVRRTARVLLFVLLAGLCAVLSAWCGRLVLGEVRLSVTWAWAFLGLAVVLIPLPRLFPRWPDTVWLRPASRKSAVALLAFATIGGVAVTWVGRDTIRPGLRSGGGRFSTLTYPRWTFDAETRVPTFMMPLQKMPAGSAVVYSPQTWVERQVPAFTAQYVLYGREPGNARAGMAARRRAAAALKPLLYAESPSDETLSLLQKYHVTHVLLSPHESWFCGALEEYPELFQPVSRIGGSALYKVSISPESIERARDRPDPWHPAPDLCSEGPPLGRIEGMTLLAAHLDETNYVPGQVGKVSLVWKCTSVLRRPIGVLTRLEMPGARINCDHGLLGNAESAYELVPGDIVKEECVFLVPTDAKVGAYVVKVGLLDADTNGGLRAESDRVTVREDRGIPYLHVAGFTVLPALGPELLKNGDFEALDKNDPSLPAAWRRRQGGAESVRALSGASAGGRGLLLEIRPHPEGRLWQILEQDLPLPDRPSTYAVRFRARVAGPGRGRVSLYVRKGLRSRERVGVLTFSSDEWTGYSFLAPVPSAGGEALELWLGQADYKDRESVIYYDDVSVRAAEEAALDQQPVAPSAAR